MGFYQITSATDWQKVQAFIRRSTCAGFYTSDPDYQFQELCNEADHQLFNMYWNNCCHPLSCRVMILENGCIPDRFQTAVLI